MAVHSFWTKLSDDSPFNSSIQDVSDKVQKVLEIFVAYVDREENFITV